MGSSGLNLIRMATLLSLFLAASSASDFVSSKQGHGWHGHGHGHGWNGHGHGYGKPKKLQFSCAVKEEDYKDCRNKGSDPRSFYDFTTEDIEKVRNVSFSDPEYTNKVLLVVNLAGF